MRELSMQEVNHVSGGSAYGLAFRDGDNTFGLDTEEVRNCMQNLFMAAPALGVAGFVAFLLFSLSGNGALLR